MDTKKVLVIEDEAVFEEILKKHFIALGVTVLSAKNGKEGLDLALNEHPDLIMTDLMMPVMDGFEFLDKLRKDSWGSSAQVFVLTNKGDADSMAESISKGGYHYFVKSEVDPAVIIDQAKNILNIA